MNKLEKEAIILLSHLEHEVNCILSNNAIKEHYPRFKELRECRKKALTYIKLLKNTRVFLQVGEFFLITRDNTESIILALHFCNFVIQFEMEGCYEV